MGSMLTRPLRDLGDIAGFEVSNDTLPAVVERKAESESRPVTPTDHRTFGFDPRSPTAEIVRTPIEIPSNVFSSHDQSPLAGQLHSRRSYLETDLDTLSTHEIIQPPENVGAMTPTQNRSLPPGLTSSHILKLRFLGLDPRSPSADVTRTPIQLGRETKIDEPQFHFDDTLSVGSMSSQDIFNNSACFSDFTRDCSDPSAFISESEDISGKEEDLDTSLRQSPVQSLSNPIEEFDIVSNSLLIEKENAAREGTPEATNKLRVFQEVKVDPKGSPATPDGAKKPSGNRSRTPLTPICNMNRTPNSILRAKQTQNIDKEILTKVKIYSADENKAPAKMRAFNSAKKENFRGVGRLGRKVSPTDNDENAVSKKNALAQWDQDTSVII